MYIYITRNPSVANLTSPQSISRKVDAFAASLPQLLRPPGISLGASCCTVINNFFLHGKRQSQTGRLRENPPVSLPGDRCHLSPESPTLTGPGVGRNEAPRRPFSRILRTTKACPGLAHWILPTELAADSLCWDWPHPHLAPFYSVSTPTTVPLSTLHPPPPPRPDAPRVAPLSYC